MASHVQVQSTATEVEEEGGRWSQLPLDLMETLLKCLSISDRICVTAVCKPWQSVTSTLGFLEAARPPWLIASTFYNWPWSLKTVVGEPVSDIKFLDNLQNKWLCGSSTGWLLISWRKHNHDCLHICLLNPITGAKVELFTCFANIANGILSASPLTKDYMFAATGYTKYHRRKVAIVRTTMGDYRSLEALNPMNIYFHGGRLYVLTQSWEVIVYEFDPDPVMLSTIRVPLRKEHDCWYDGQLAELNDDILIIAYGLHLCQEFDIKVFKLPEMADDPVVQVNSLGGGTLLISQFSEAVSTKGSAAFREDCIYGFSKCSRETMMAYSMKDEGMFELAGIGLRHQTLAWFTPDLSKMETSNIETPAMNLEA
ncbi:unnamed protein product [Musa acuminata subsp. malaccensis]|uniref:(wild Malaysian banana) hypothetical protein n=1 Tax=Musa acuminata subsp. malaccensis TaxID=214687 RepID=A0A804KPN3_MUSAM|nr:PREDICTED: F-box/kelch-repeat protein At1g57790-like [Musa acuminata subsp. malaccensis]CAG1836745.1 unnamed protein product [Musa acuminata subsp. malaccensis]